MRRREGEPYTTTLQREEAHTLKVSSHGSDLTDREGRRRTTHGGMEGQQRRRSKHPPHHRPNHTPEGRDSNNGLPMRPALQISNLLSTNKGVYQLLRTFIGRWKRLRGNSLRRITQITKYPSKTANSMQVTKVHDLPNQGRASESREPIIIVDQKTRGRGRVERKNPRDLVRDLLNEYLSIVTRTEISCPSR